MNTHIEIPLTIHQIESLCHLYYRYREIIEHDVGVKRNPHEILLLQHFNELADYLLVIQKKTKKQAKLKLQPSAAIAFIQTWKEVKIEYKPADVAVKKVFEIIHRQGIAPTPGLATKY